MGNRTLSSKASAEGWLVDESAILDHAESPYHRGRAPNASCAHTERNAACGDWVRLELVLDAGGGVQQAWFDGGGCLISQAAASILCRAVEGKTIRELRELTAQQMLDLLEVPLTPRRMQCGLLAFKVLKTMVYSLGSATGPESRQPGEERTRTIMDRARGRRRMRRHGTGGVSRRRAEFLRAGCAKG